MYDTDINAIYDKKHADYNHWGGMWIFWNTNRDTPPVSSLKEPRNIVTLKSFEHCYAR
jgi:hypothetical protein